MLVVCGEWWVVVKVVETNLMLSFDFCTINVYIYLLIHSYDPFVSWTLTVNQYRNTILIIVL